MNFETTNDISKDKVLEELLAGDPRLASNNRTEFKKERVADAYQEAVARGELPPIDRDDKFFNELSPNYHILHEQPIHRAMIFMKARGSSNKEIAQELGVSPITVSNVLRQPWARVRMSKIINGEGHEAIKIVLQGAALDSVYKLIDLRDDQKTPPAVQRASCVDLLDRFLGKPTQQVEVKSDPYGNKSVDELSMEERALKAEEARLLGAAAL